MRKGFIIKNTIQKIIVSSVAALSLVFTIPSVASAVTPVAPVTSTTNNAKVGVHVNGPWTGDYSLENSLKDLDVLRDANVKHIRLPIYWAFMSSSPGQVNSWEVDKLDQFMSRVTSYGMKVNFVVWGTPVYGQESGKGAQYLPDSQFSAYADFLKYLANRYGGSVRSFEVGNELNHFVFAGENPNPERYAKLLKTVYPVVKGSFPNVSIVANGLANEFDDQFAGLSLSPATYLDRMYKAGVKGSFDAVAVHPYDWYNPGVWTRGVDGMRKVMVANSDGARKIWITEDGASTSAGYMTPTQQLDYYKKEFTAYSARSSFMGAIYIYAARDIGVKGSADREDGFGLVYNDYSPKPSYTYIKNYLR